DTWPARWQQFGWQSWVDEQELAPLVHEFAADGEVHVVCPVLPTSQDYLVSPGDPSLVCVCEPVEVPGPGGESALVTVVARVEPLGSHLLSRNDLVKLDRRPRADPGAPVQVRVAEVAEGGFHPVAFRPLGDPVGDDHVPPAVPVR